MDYENLMKKIIEIGANTGELQQKLRLISAEGNAGAGLVKIDFNGLMEVNRVYIAPELLNEPDREMIEDLIKSAITDGSRKVRQKMQTEAVAQSGLNIPPGFMGS